MSAMLRAVALLVALSALSACPPNQGAAPCTGPSDCQLEGGGMCLPAPLGGTACAYPDQQCASGLHWGAQAGDIAGQCIVTNPVDAGVDAEVDALDASPIDANGIVDPFVIRAGTSAGDSGRAVAAHGTGIVVAGAIGGSTNFGGGPRSGPTFVARFDFDGGHIWSRGIGANSADVAVDSMGAVAVGGNFTQPFTLGTQADTLTPVVMDGYVAKLSANAGDHLWSKRIGGAGADNVNAVGVFANGDVLVVGTFMGTVNLGGADLVAVGSSTNSYVARLAGASGAHVWSVALAGTQDNEPTAAFVDAGGNVVVAGFFRGSITVGATPHASNGESDVFVAKLAGLDGARLWSSSFGGAGFEGVGAVGPGSDGSVLVGARQGGPMSIGGTPVPYAGMTDGVAVSFDGTTGLPRWTFPLGTPSNESIRGIADVGGVVIVAAEFSQGLMFGAQSLTPVGGVDILVGRLSLAGGAPMGAVRYGGSGNETIGRIVGDGSVFAITGSFQQSVDFGIATLAATGAGADIFAGKLQP